MLFPNIYFHSDTSW